MMKCFFKIFLVVYNRHLQIHSGHNDENPVNNGSELTLNYGWRKYLTVLLRGSEAKYIC